MPWKSFIRLFLFFFVTFLQQPLIAQVKKAPSEKQMVSFEAAATAFPLVNKGASAIFYVEPGTLAGIKRTVSDLKKDISMVTGVHPDSTDKLQGKHLVIAGTIGENTAIDQLIQSGKLDVKSIRGTWENHIIQTVKNPFPGVEDALVIAGSDKRGTIYGLYTLSDHIGVSPWYCGQTFR